MTLNDCIEEACYWNGQVHGLTIQYGEKLVLVALYKNGEIEANFSFDHAFKQQNRGGFALNVLKSEHFNPKVDCHFDVMPR